MAKAPPLKGYAPSGFFVFRTPLLPYEEVEAWSEGLAAPAAMADPKAFEAAWQADRETLRKRLDALVARPEVREALFVASPSLEEGIRIWLDKPDSKKGLRAERALVRYFLRMASRATPFGLFSGCSVGLLGEETRIEVAPRDRYQRHTRLDMDYLFALTEDLGRDPALRQTLRYFPNSSLYRTAGRLRYAEARLDGRVRSHHLVAVESTEYLEDTLGRARDGARVEPLAQALVDSDPEGEIRREEADEFIQELIDSQILVSDLAPAVTGPEPIHGLIEQLAEHPAGAEAASRLESVRGALASLDATPVGSDPEHYRAVATSLEALPTKVELPRLFQVDMVKPAPGPLLSEAVMTELARGTEILLRLASRPGEDGLDRFRTTFSERYGEGCEMPLVEVLDEEAGIGFERDRGAGADASPLLQGLALGGEGREPTYPWGTRQTLLLAKLADALQRGSQEIVLKPEDLDKMATRGELPPLPNAFHVMGTLAARSPEALAKGDFQLLLRGSGGPSGARLLGRFCHADPEVEKLVGPHLAAEEAHDPDAIFAEIVHLPEGRIGNILCRPVLRRYEIPYLGRSGTDREHQIPVDDLLVTVRGPQIILRSARLGRRVVPRLTSAHNFVRRSLGVYRFLCALQSQGVLAGVGWSWGLLDNAPFLPRVRTGRLVLSRASWQLTKEEIEALGKPQGAAGFRAVQEWRQKRRLPRLALVADYDNELLVDFDNALSVDTFVDLLKNRPSALLVECFPGPEALIASGPEGRFVHELVVPVVRSAEQEERPAARAAAAVAAAAAVTGSDSRHFPPGSDWLYAKLYTGTATADRILTGTLAPLVQEVLATGAADGWFFIRYGDPEWHLRVRFHGRPDLLHREVLPRLQQAVAPLLADGHLWRFQLDTYDREVERYGGSEAVPLVERLFHADSDAVLALLAMIEGDEGADLRWRLTLRGIDALLDDLGLDLEGRRKLLGQVRAGFGREFDSGGNLRHQLGERFRKEWESLEKILDPANDATSDLTPAFEVFRRRSRAWASAIGEIQELERQERLFPQLADMAASLVHMHVNRMIRAVPRAHEAVLYDFLHRIYESRAARERQAADAAAEPAAVEVEPGARANPA